MSKHLLIGATVLGGILLASNANAYFIPDPAKPGGFYGTAGFTSNLSWMPDTQIGRVFPSSDEFMPIAEGDQELFIPTGYGNIGHVLANPLWGDQTRVEAFGSFGWGDNKQTVTGRAGEFFNIGGGGFLVDEGNRHEIDAEYDSWNAGVNVIFDHRVLPRTTISPIVGLQYQSSDYDLRIRSFESGGFNFANTDIMIDSHSYGLNLATYVTHHDVFPKTDFFWGGHMMPRLMKWDVDGFQDFSQVNGSGDFFRKRGRTRWVWDAGVGAGLSYRAAPNLRLGGKTSFDFKSVPGYRESPDGIKPTTERASEWKVTASITYGF